MKKSKLFLSLAFASAMHCLVPAEALQAVRVQVMMLRQHRETARYITLTLNPNKTVSGRSLQSFIPRRPVCL